MSLGSPKQDINKIRENWAINNKYVFLRQGNTDEFIFYTACVLSAAVLFNVGRGVYNCMTNVKEDSE